ncbi:hypothetical protein OIO90_000179 [Microbotryomycetes sp. JL221]|nr:hypothetical protein OIO90_000179 [Microbotryomycetes sp. JL221]
MRQRSALVLVLLVLGLLLAYPILTTHSFLSYATRPLWDHDEAPSLHLQHVTTDDTMTTSADNLCRLHDMAPRQTRAPVWDAVTFSTELDLLKIRLYELDPVVEHFFIVESNVTFTGLPKPILLRSLLNDNNQDFKPYRHKITYHVHEGRQLSRGENPFTQENEVRVAMSNMLTNAINQLDDNRPNPILIFSDVDELISRKTARLLSLCDFKPPLHLGLRDYLYSFEFDASGSKQGVSSWRASANVWPMKGRGQDEFYRHGKQTERVLANSGWHCSWCFKTLQEFVTKATGYSHVDRLGNRPSNLLRPDRIQQTICSGSDFFGMLPEAYSWREMASKWRLLKSTEIDDPPALLRDEPDKFPYLMPGGCIRQDA